MAFHVLNQRRTAEAERFHLEAKMTILEDLSSKIRSQDPPNLDDVGRLLKLAETHSLEAATEYDVTVAPRSAVTPSWRETIFGRKFDTKKEDTDLEEVKRQWEAGEYCLHVTRLPVDDESPPSHSRACKTPTCSSTTYDCSYFNTPKHWPQPESQYPSQIETCILLDTGSMNISSI